LWVSDFTCVATWAGFVYVAFVVDIFWTCPALVERHWLIWWHVFRTEPGW
jgi:hypothetical protein